MLYDIKTGKIENVFQVTEMQIKEDENYQLKVFYNNRTIIIQNYINSFYYYNIDSKKLKNVIISLEGFENGSAYWECSDDEFLFFGVGEDYNIASPVTTPSKIYKVLYGTVEPIFLKEIIYDGRMYPIYDNIYYIDYDGIIKNLKLIE